LMENVLLDIVLVQVNLSEPCLAICIHYLVLSIFKLLLYQKLNFRLHHIFKTLKQLLLLFLFAL
jgi:hypothetical protein